MPFRVSLARVGASSACAIDQDYKKPSYVLLER
jgi:hypothetical protein